MACRSDGVICNTPPLSIPLPPFDLVTSAEDFRPFIILVRASSQKERHVCSRSEMQCLTQIADATSRSVLRRNNQCASVRSRRTCSHGTVLPGPFLRDGLPESGSIIRLTTERRPKVSASIPQRSARVVGFCLHAGVASFLPR